MTSVRDDAVTPKYFSDLDGWRIARTVSDKIKQM